MNPVQPISLSDVHEVRDQCLCFATQRAARVLARRFDKLFAPLGMTNGQYSLMVVLAANRQPRLGELAEFLAMDQTTLTAGVHALEKRGLVLRTPDPKDRRAARISLTPAGHDVVAQAVPLWRAEMAALRAEYGADRASELVGLLQGLGVPPSLARG